MGLFAAMVLTACAVWFLSGGNTALEKETKPIAVDYVNAISANWNPDDLRARTDPGLIKAMSSQGQGPEELMKIYSTLGRLKSEVKCLYRSASEFMKGGEQHDTISYECAVTYEKGPAVVALTLTKSRSEKQWLIYYINIHSDVFGEVIE